MNPPTLSVVIPTRNRPDRLRDCLAALAIARQNIEFECCVCDSTQDGALRQKVALVVEQSGFAKYFYHTGNNVAAARNFCAQSASGDLLVNVDDDIYVETESIKRLYDYYNGLLNKDAIVGGSVKFGDTFSRPVVMRAIGYGREAHIGERYDFIVGAFMLYPRVLAQRYPWNERIKTSDDRFMGSLWRKIGVELHFVESAKAIHDIHLNSYDATQQQSHIYANLFDAIFVRKSVYWLFCFEFLGFAAGAKKYFQPGGDALAYVKAWYLGHKDFIRDVKYLQISGQSKSSMKLTVLVPSYRRPADLFRCLTALSMQTRPAEQILVVIRSDDEETLETIRSLQHRLPLEAVLVEIPGQVHALNVGLAHCTGDVVAITDDDAAPRPEWLSRIEGHFASDPKIGGVGGRDWIYNDGIIELGDSNVVGRILWFGRVVGDHHRGSGPVRDVDILKGANCSFRMAAIKPIGFDTRLRGSGAQVHNDMLVSLALRHAGWRLIYDPQVTVDHYLGRRHDHDQRGKLNRDATVDRAYNLRLAMNEIQPAWRRMVVLFWQFAIGTREAPGLAWLWRHGIHGKKNILAVYQATMVGWRQAAHASKIRDFRDLA